MANKIVLIEAAIPKDYNVEFWYKPELEEMPESEQEHVKALLQQGYNQGQLIYQDAEGKEYEGWWNLLED